MIVDETSPAVGAGAAYAALAEGDTGRAVQLAHALTRSAPEAPEGWLVLGGAALSMREGAQAARFFVEAERLAPDEPLAQEGLSKAAMLAADPVQALASAERAFDLGSRDAGLARIYLDLMALFGRRSGLDVRAAPAVRASGDPALARALAAALLDADRPRDAVEWLDLCWRFDPDDPEGRTSHMLALILTHQFDAALAFHAACRADGCAPDGLVALAMRALRETGDHRAALDLMETHPFEDTQAYMQAVAVSANLHVDEGRYDLADAAYVEALALSGQPASISKSYGAFLFCQRRFDAGQPHFARRIPEQGRRLIRPENALPDALKARERVFLLAEQGIGDQLALLSLLAAAPLDPARQEIFLVGDDRFESLLSHSELPLTVLRDETFMPNLRAIDPREIVYLGDLVQYLGDTATGLPHGGYIAPDPARRDALRAAYRAAAGDGPVVGVSWHTGNPLGHLRTLPLDALLAAVPPGALVVSLQYGDTDADIAAAQAARPDLRILADPGIDQMTDLAGFAAQVSAMDAVLSIDNTTAHLCGALGHPNTHVLLPSGSECMWYWGREGAADPWYGCLTLHRQTTFGDWSAPLATAGAALAAAKPA